MLPVNPKLLAASVTVLPVPTFLSAKLAVAALLSKATLAKSALITPTKLPKLVMVAVVRAS